MVNKIEELLTGLVSGQHEVEKDFEFHTPDSTEDSESFKDDILIIFDEYSISCNVEWSYTRVKGLKGDRLTPNDPDDVILDYIDIDDFEFFVGEDEQDINLNEHPKLRKIFLTYIIELLKDGYVDNVSPNVYKHYLKESKILKFKDFIK